MSDNKIKLNWIEASTGVFEAGGFRVTKISTDEFGHEFMAETPRMVGVNTQVPFTYSIHAREWCELYAQEILDRAEKVRQAIQ